MAESISSGRIVNKKEIVLDPNFVIPPGLTGVRSKTLDELIEPIDASSTDNRGSIDDFIEDPTIIEDDFGTDSTFVLEAPQDIRIISQTLRFGPSGSQVVDVVIEVNDIPGATNYEVRLSKP